MQRPNTTIDLSSYQTKGAKMFIGRDRGRQVREDSQLDKIAGEVEKITIVVPSDTFSINPSFLEEFFRNVIKKFGKEGFKNKFEFVNEGAYRIKENLETAIDRVLRQTNALPDS